VRTRGAQGRIELRGSEVPLFTRCGNESLALASAPSGEVPGGTALATCPAAVMAASPQAPSGCPPWTARISWREGKTIYSVAAVADVQSGSLAARAGENRARSEIANVIHYTATVGGGASVRTQEESAPTTSGTETATCDGATYVKAAATAP
jgi:hypothetical protein